MLHADLWGTERELTLDAGFARLWENPARRDELRELLDVLDDLAMFRGRCGSRSRSPCPSTAAYTRDEVLAATGISQPERPLPATRGCQVRRRLQMRPLPLHDHEERAPLLAEHDVPGLRDLAAAHPLGVAEHNDRTLSHRSALHPPRQQGSNVLLVRPRDAGRSCLHVPRHGPLRQPCGRAPDGGDVGTGRHRSPSRCSRWRGSPPADPARCRIRGRCPPRW